MQNAAVQMTAVATTNRNTPNPAPIINPAESAKILATKMLHERGISGTGGAATFVEKVTHDAD